MGRPVYKRPGSLEEAIGILGGRPWTLLAGGTDLMVRMKDGALRPEGLLDLTGLRELRSIEINGGDLVIGALATHSEIERSDLVVRHAAALARAVSLIGSPQIRNRGTLGGNLANASPAADTVPPLFVLDAQVCLAGPGGERRVPVTEFAKGPGSTVRGQDEIITAVRVPVHPGGFQSSFVRLGARKALAVAKLSVAFGAGRAADGR
ncbi:MAG: hypothetical protein GXP54_04675, partial [Deltaproteobacteria bacterium]|nr:hypothetical protein [Deltaproteobacteria bacterium]